MKQMKRELQACEEVDSEHMRTEHTVDAIPDLMKVNDRIQEAEENFVDGETSDILDIREDLDWIQGLHPHAEEVFIRKKIEPEIIYLREMRGFDEVVFELEQEKNERLHNLNNGNE